MEVGPWGQLSLSWDGDTVGMLGTILRDQWGVVVWQWHYFGQLVAGGYTRTTNVQDRDGKKLLTGQQSQLAWRRSKGATLFPLTTLLRRCWGWRSYTIPTSTARLETCSSSPLLSEGFLSPVSTQMFPCYRQFSRETNAEAERDDVGGQLVQSPGGMVDGQVVHFSVPAETEGLIHGVGMFEVQSLQKQRDLSTGMLEIRFIHFIL